MVPRIAPQRSRSFTQPTPLPVVLPGAPARVDFPMTIRLRLTLWYTALLGSTLILFSFIFYSTLAGNLWMQSQQDAARQAGEVANTLAQQLQGNILIIRHNPTRVQFPDLDFFSNSVGVQIIDLNGMILKRSNNLGPMSVHNYAIALPTIRNGKTHRFYTTSENDVPLLVYTVPIIANQTIVGAVQVIKPVAGVENTLNQVSRYLIIGTALSLILAAIVGAFLARRALAPVDTITQTAGAISRTKDLSRRLNIPNDSSEVGQLAATFNEMLDRIQQLFKTQERLIADVSHELRTPLTTVQGNLDLLRRYAATVSQDPERAQQIAGMLQETMTEAESETARMSTMITDLLTLAQVDSGALQLQREPVEMDTLLLDVYRQTRRMAQQRRGPNALEIRLGSEDQALVYGDRERLRQILLNLADNAIKYTPNGGMITLGLEKSEEWVKISVSDTGMGISTEDQPYLFDRFYRTDKARSSQLGGSGLGLSIVQWIAQAHQGKVTVSSELQKGSTFTLWLPAYHEP
ncbi:MAG: HAMP domain-containing protein [Caldilineaceae bacterium]|nr:HAMP domain-containing protein [Caldilineaceae bacterium]